MFSGGNKNQTSIDWEKIRKWLFEKPYFRASRKDFTEVYECDEYKCDAHPNGCMFCKHNTDVFYDYTNGPYMIVCDGNHSTKKGFIGKCKHFER